mmetsp:Transcript_18460/g.58290  ORF Transcript_18460/g.58290 Transcript_18460/m.58290 type:complete len:264 (+) Transcript_18460:4550-5341(+)
MRARVLPRAGRPRPHEQLSHFLLSRARLHLARRGRARRRRGGGRGPSGVRHACRQLGAAREDLRWPRTLARRPRPRGDERGLGRAPWSALPLVPGCPWRRAGGRWGRGRRRQQRRPGEGLTKLMADRIGHARLLAHSSAWPGLWPGRRGLALREPGGRSPRAREPGPCARVRHARATHARVRHARVRHALLVARREQPPAIPASLAAGLAGQLQAGQRRPPPWRPVRPARGGARRRPRPSCAVWRRGGGGGVRHPRRRLRRRA